MACPGSCGCDGNALLDGPPVAEGGVWRARNAPRARCLQLRPTDERDDVVAAQLLAARARQHAVDELRDALQHGAAAGVPMVLHKGWGSRMASALGACAAARASRQQSHTCTACAAACVLPAAGSTKQTAVRGARGAPT